MEECWEELTLIHAHSGAEHGPGAGWWIDVGGSLELLADGNVAREVILRRFREDGWELFRQVAFSEGILSLHLQRQQA